MKTAPDKWGTPIKRDLSGIEHLRLIRSVKSFEQFPKGTQDVYLAVARCFPGVQVWAVGSRVRGEYICLLTLQEIGYSYAESWQEYERVTLARKAAGMKQKGISDFDFLVSPDAVQIGELPPNTERVRCVIPISERIEIPIFYGLELEQTT